MGLIVQRVFILACLMMGPIACLWWFSAHVLRQFFISPHIAELAQEYIRHCLPGLVGVTLMDVLRRYVHIHISTTL